MRRCVSILAFVSFVVNHNRIANASFVPKRKRDTWPSHAGPRNTSPRPPRRSFRAGFGADRACKSRSDAASTSTPQRAPRETAVELERVGVLAREPHPCVRVFSQPRHRGAICTALDDIDLLVNNAGVMMPPKREETAELRVAVRHASATRVRWSAKSGSWRPRARVVNVSLGAELRPSTSTTCTGRSARSTGWARAARAVWVLFTLSSCSDVRQGAHRRSRPRATPAGPRPTCRRRARCSVRRRKLFAMEKNRRCDAAVPKTRSAADYGGGIGTMRG